ncbi:M48 family metallopeptidase [Methyloversatilis sp.]|uniref:M48 family metallopeptidase n=1 Tax=Methyloversatilis sp. TaxID=2569862 RepID=UPI0035B034C3
MNPPSRQQRLRRRLALRAAACLALLGITLLGCVVLIVRMLCALEGRSGLEALTVLAALLAGSLLGSILLGWLWVPAPEGHGILLPDELVPGFRRRIDRLCDRLGARRIHRVLITMDVNAAVVCRPALGAIGPMRNTLLLGIPLAHSLTPRQLSAVLAHELAHLSAQRDAVGAWGAHLRAWWLRCFDRIDAHRSFAAHCARHLFAATARIDLTESIELSRLDEFEADRLAARAVGGPALVGALIEVAMKDRFLQEDYWTKVMEQARSRRRPVIRPFREMGLGMQVGFVRHDALAGLDHLLRTSPPADAPDTHPSLAERLAALRVGHNGGTEEAPEGPSAAQHYFADLLPALSAAFDRMWWQSSSEDWLRAYHEGRVRLDRQ